ncbi:hypothetical protein [Paenibacillus montanisoli]|uniref:Uncharacterized protein n=1 Tax=Paenibacillus montanisoli TaxID=2081970 RepID=A0A328U4J4_9BACL|nr:hypothetical protein [Paenibacillus montanisoli]RAP77738.1 hypothetical protein DL346_04560 [Paenibacillus montanisoli]
MKEWLEGWLVCFILMIIGGFFLWRTLKDVIGHVKNYRVEKAENRVGWWYFEWLFILADAIWGSLTRPAVFISLLFFLVGTIGLVVNTIKIIAGLFK